MGGPRLVEIGSRLPAQTFGDVLHEIAQLNPRAAKDLELLARWKLQMLKIEPPPLRAKDLLRR